ncbi:diguanylate cyclase [Geobacter sp. FeAm09]|uniref:CBS domain-containing protein n=1 Tax=Geobacter sp. FeAm09 TaxID=2597769 RepID=UPI0011F00CD1|nr:CBS domain-containing protein [Geobacter sp. FeAm09]QEM69985.1 diguanylate cyclase [Geobacter sp. FeAm09]
MGMTTGTTKTRIRQIISRQVISVTPETPAEEAVATMARARISCLIVAEKKRPLGIFTERDLVKLANQQVPFGNRPIRDLMTSPVVTISGNLNIYEAYSLMLTNRIRHHVVVDHAGRILGLMTQSDLINHLGHEYFVELRKIEQVMTTGVMTVASDAPISEALGIMAGPGISCVVVADQRQPLGIMTERDAVRLVAEGVDLATVPVSRAMSSPVLTVTTGTTVYDAALAMKREKIRRVVVVDKEGRIEGIITQSDIIKGLEGRYIESLKEIIRKKENIFQQTARELLDKTIFLDNILRSSISMAIVATDSSLRIKYFNPVAEQVFGYEAASVIGRSAAEVLILEDIAPLGLMRARETVLSEGKCTFPVEIHRNGATFYYDGSLSGILDKQDKLAGFVLMLNDITERRQHEDTIHHLAYHDALTGLPNRILLNDRLGQALASARRTGTRGALMILDLDRFKDINDSLGHSMGDLLLQAVGDRLRGLLRKSDTVSRMGGDEFVLLLPSIASAESAAVTAAKIVTAFNKPFVCSGRPLSVTASIGIADFPDDGGDAETLLKNADIALYRVKEAGRNDFQRYTPPPGNGQQDNRVA